MCGPKVGGRHCADTQAQISSALGALRGVGRSLLRNHLRHCATHAIQKGSPEEVEARYDELVELMYTHAR